jgi:hypothetical protein
MPIAKMPWMNLHRTYQATFLLPYLLQDSLTEGQKPGRDDSQVVHRHRVLQVLGRMMAPPTSEDRPNPLTMVDTCFPSILTLCRETALSDSSVRRALDWLIANGYVTKSRIPGRKLRKGRGQNKFAGCRYHVVPEVWDLIDSPVDPATKKDTSVVPARASAVPVRSNEDRELEQAIADDLGGGSEVTDFPCPTEKKHYRHIEAMIDLLKLHFGHHPTFAMPQVTDWLTSCLEACIDKAGSAEVCWWTLASICNLPKFKDIRDAVGKSRMLAGYIRQSFPQWLADVNGEATLEYILTGLCDGLYIETPTDLSFFIDPARFWLQEKLGEHLLRFDSFPKNDEVMTMRADISEAYKATRVPSDARPEEPEESDPYDPGAKADLDPEDDESWYEKDPY